MNVQKMTRDQKNKAISVAYELITDDGRIVKVTRWRPCLEVAGRVTVEVEGFIQLPESDE